MTKSSSEDFLSDLINRRRKLIEGLDANQGEINLDIFEDFYPDKAHFVYELLQNAEDACATEVTFTLTADSFICEHDGRKFTEEDVSGITGINNSTKSKDPEKIGKFGVGFKSVFVYTQFPTVRSGDFAFRIIKLILPEPIVPDASLGKRTRFELPFDSPKKPPKEAYEEIAAGLRDMDETTLLFLSNLQRIRWKIDSGVTGQVFRRGHSDCHLEVLKQEGEEMTSNSHFLKFEEPVEGLKHQHIAVAFPLDFLAGIRQFDASKSLCDQMRITQANPGRVAVFFTAAKEASGLRFHLHAPFVPELSRASIKETTANDPLFEQLAALSARSLHRIRDLGLLTAEFLAVLPNPQDQIPPRYQGIRKAIIAEMRSAPLTPTYTRGHAQANCLIQAKASLKDLLSNADIEYLVERTGAPAQWAVGVTQKNNRIDNFLDGLGIQQWGIEEFVDILKTSAAADWIGEADEEFIAWLKGKSVGWMRQLYTLLYDELSESDSISMLSGLQIVRLDDGTLGIANQTYFPADSTTARDLPTVDIALYASARSKAQQEKVRTFLLDLGVRELGEAEEIEIILKSRYAKPTDIRDEKTYRDDLRRFIALTEKQPEAKSLFSQYYIFEGTDEDWHTPSGIYLDTPYKETDLSAYYSKLGEEADRQPLHEYYAELGVASERLGKFAEATGATTKLGIERIYCRYNPKWNYLRAVPGERATSPIDRDYYVPHLQNLLKSPELALSRLVWRTIAALSQFSSYFQAVYQLNTSSGARHAESMLLHDLIASRWVPQIDGSFVRPEDALREMLPEGFPFDPGYGGLKVIHFGEAAARRTVEVRQKEEVAKAAGFPDVAALDRARRFAALPAQEQERFLLEQSTATTLAAIPDRDPANPTRRAQAVTAQARAAPDKESEIRPRSVSIGREEIKQVAEEYLQQHYRNAGGGMTCQICKGPLPFKRNDGSDFFEVVEFLPELRKRHSQNYLALCPNHAAMYQYANASPDEMRMSFHDLTGNELGVVIGQQELTIYFSKVHILDMRAVLKAEEGLTQDGDDDTGGEPEDPAVSKTAPMSL
jgi:hypothetical protein